MKATPIHIFLLILFSLLSYAQNIPFERKWDKKFGGIGTNRFANMVSLSDGSIVLFGSADGGIGGEKTDTSRGQVDYWLVKVDSSGNKVWDKTFGGINGDVAYKIIQTNDAGFLLAGYSNSDSSGDRTQSNRGFIDYWIVKTDSLGNKLWDKRFGGNANDYLYNVVQADDGGFLLGGYSLSGANGDKTQTNWGSEDFWLVKTDWLGNKIWDKRIGGTGTDIMYGLENSSSGGFLVGGRSNSPISGDKSTAYTGFGGSDFWLVSIDSSGNKLWDKTYNGGYYEELISIKKTFDGGFVLGGTSYSAPSCHVNWATYWLIKIDSSGNQQWRKGYGSQDYIYGEYFYDVVQTNDSGFLICGEATGFPGANGCNKTEGNLDVGQIWVVKTNSLGVQLWDKTILSPSNFGPRSWSQLMAVPTSDGCYAVANATYDDVRGYKTAAGSGYWLLKFCPCNLSVPPSASFVFDQYYSPDTVFGTDSAFICAHNSLMFVNTSECSSTCHWIFDGGNPAVSSNAVQYVSYSDTGNFSVTLISTSGAGSDTIFLPGYIHVLPNDLPVITQDADTLISTPAMSYQWYNDHGLIPGATSQIYIPDSSDYYHVCVTYGNGCENCTVRHYYSKTTGLPGPDLSAAEIKLFPNPFLNELNVRIRRLSGNDRIIIKDIAGKVVLQQYLNNNETRFSTGHISPGFYLLQYSSNSGSMTFKIVKQ